MGLGDEGGLSGLLSGLRINRSLQVWMGGNVAVNVGGLLACV